MKNIYLSIFIVAIIISGLIWLRSIEPTEEEIVAERGEIISERGIHWHPELRIFVKGEEVIIPKNIGLLGVHSPIHTHEDLPIIHLEFNSIVREKDIELGEFFEVWGKDFMELGTTVVMTVNGTPNTELDKYRMKDGDKIELYYE